MAHIVHVSCASVREPVRPDRIVEDLETALMHADRIVETTLSLSVRRAEHLCGEIEDPCAL